MNAATIPATKDCLGRPFKHDYSGTRPQAQVKDGMANFTNGTSIFVAQIYTDDIQSGNHPNGRVNGDTITITNHYGEVVGSWSIPELVSAEG